MTGSAVGRVWRNEARSNRGHMSYYLQSRFVISHGLGSPPGVSSFQGPDEPSQPNRSHPRPLPPPPLFRRHLLCRSPCPARWPSTCVPVKEAVPSPINCHPQHANRSRHHGVSRDQPTRVPPTPSRAESSLGREGPERWISAEFGKRGRIGPTLGSRGDQGYNYGYSTGLAR